MSCRQFRTRWGGGLNSGPLWSSDKHSRIQPPSTKSDIQTTVTGETLCCAKYPPCWSACKRRANWSSDDAERPLSTLESATVESATQATRVTWLRLSSAILPPKNWHVIS